MNPTPEKLQAMRVLIAELLGWTRGNSVSISRCKGGLHEHWHDKDGNCQGPHLPNWPGDRNASSELPIEKTPAAWNAYCRALDYYDELLELPFDGRHHATVESLAWLLYKGYRWVECVDCEGEGQLAGEVSCEEDLPFAKMEPCHACNSQGGKFVKEKNYE
ncbi:hypothetical protein LCGC14_0428450 [marine sediment metagenome]|uniref:Uncharacterized protein n=1 Tax=marine sediment metagenome TaxID=412755 RepID=A0A0F9SNR1_9ZZZZ